MNEFSRPTQYGNDDAIENANAWVARFAPLVMGEPGVTESELKDRLKLIDDLREQAPLVSEGLRMLVSSKHDELRETFGHASGQLDSIENDLRKRLARVAPGDPDGMPDLDQLQERLHERAARQEMGLPTEMPAILSEHVSAGNWAAAAFTGVFSFAWLSFTTFHAFFMIGGMMEAFGWAALAMLGFYSIFFFAGFAMVAATIAAASSEAIEVNGHELTIRRELLGWKREKRYRLKPGSKASVGVAETRMNNNRGTKNPAVLVTDENGKTISFGANASAEQRTQLVRRINAYLQANPTV